MLLIKISRLFLNLNYNLCTFINSVIFLSWGKLARRLQSYETKFVYYIWPLGLPEPGKQKYVQLITATCSYPLHCLVISCVVQGGMIWDELCGAYTLGDK